jgi:N-acetyl sugar amidotransferase
LPETHETLVISDDGVCNVCKAQEDKGDINWKLRKNELDTLINQYIGKGKYDCIIPFSGGKDSTWTLYYLMNNYPKLKPLVVRFNHGFLRDTLRENSTKTFRKLGVDVHEFTPNWNVVKRLMLQAFLEKGDFCWHCHTGIFSYPMQVAIKEETPLIFWGEPSAEYTAYYSYNEKEEVNEERFNRYINLGISADDMAIRLEDTVDERDLEPYRYPKLKDLMRINYRSVCLGSYIPWDVKKQVKIIKEKLEWQGDRVENVPEEYDYEKIECWMQGVRDYIKFIKRGYTRPTHLAAIDLRNKRISTDKAKQMINQYEGKKPKSLDLFLEYTGLTEAEFYNIAMEHTVSPWKFNKENYGESEKLDDYGTWNAGEGLNRKETEKQCSGFMNSCEKCGI